VKRELETFQKQVVTQAKPIEKTAQKASLFLTNVMAFTALSEITYDISLNQPDKPFWTLSVDDALNQLGTSRNGLTQDDAHKRLLRFGANLLKPKSRTDTLTLLINQFKSP